VQLVYEAEQRDLRAEPLIDEQFVVPDAYTAVLVRGTERHRARIDGLITKFATGWPLSRMPALDRAVLRIAVYELGHEPEVPTAVILNEAVEFANSYSTDDSGRFINGVLASVAVEVRPDDGPVSASSELLANTSAEVVASSSDEALTGPSSGRTSTATAASTPLMKRPESSDE